MSGSMSRRLPYVIAGLLVFAAAVVVWRGKSARSTTPVSQSLAADAAMLATSPGKWRSKVMKLTVRDGKVQERILEMQFIASSRSGQSNAPDAQAKLFTASRPQGIPHLMEGSSSFGDGSFQDVRLRETNGVRTITITRALDPNDPNPARTLRRYERFYSVSFRYELNDDVLTLKGFPTTTNVSWGVSTFIVPTEEIEFKLAR